jgi:dTMP kinase
MARGKFITIEGGEGVGKTTQIAALRDALQARGLEVVITREPGGTPRAEKIRELLLESSQERMPVSCELLLFFAARSTHIASVIQPAIERGAWVICDRFIDSTYAYQGGGRGRDVSQIAILEKLVMRDFGPDITLLLDAPLEISEARVAMRAGKSDRMEQEKRDFFERVRSVYLARAYDDPDRVVIVDASRDRDAVHVAMWSALLPLLPAKHELELETFGI